MISVSQRFIPRPVLAPAFQLLDPPQDFPKQRAGNGHLGQLECHTPGMVDDLRPDLDQFLPQLWVKPQLGMGNYWRVSHEFLLLGVRGKLAFADRTVRSWQVARRTVHSRKPFLFRSLIERVSPGPYLELYGREEQPSSGWTVYGNQVERRLF